MWNINPLAHGWKWNNISVVNGELWILIYFPQENKCLFFVWELCFETSDCYFAYCHWLRFNCDMFAWHPPPKCFQADQTLTHTSSSTGLFTRGGLSCGFVCLCCPWVGLMWVLDGDVLTEYQTEQKGPLFCTEEMGVLLGKFGRSDWKNKGGVA